MRYRTFALLCAFILVPLTVHAQFDLFGGDLSLRVAPEYPRPNSQVLLSITSSLLDLSASDITWYANDAVITEGEGVVETEVSTGALGSETNIRVEVRGPDGNATTEGVLRPTEIDLLWESDSYVPPFYGGRALPSAGSNVRLFVIPRFQRTGESSLLPEGVLIYTWKKNGKLISSASGRGKNSALIPGPVLFGTDTIDVEVRTSDRSLQGVASVRISSVEPYLTLYENHPVFGVLYHRALPSSASVPEVETVFSAVPYFAPVSNADNRSLVYTWQVNGSDVEASSAHPSALTINAEGSTGQALIELALTHVTNYFLSVSRAWNITFGEIGGASASDPFGSPE